MTASEKQVLAGLRKVLRRRGVKLTDLASQIGVPYRSLQNYMAGTSRMPLDVYLRICGSIGITPDYPIAGRFRLDHHALQRAIADTLGESLKRLSVSEDSVLSIESAPSRVEAGHDQRVSGFLAAIIAGRYDTIREASLDDDGE
jgi:hypothetical protein